MGAQLCQVRIGAASATKHLTEIRFKKGDGIGLLDPHGCSRCWLNGGTGIKMHNNAKKSDFVKHFEVLRSLHLLRPDNRN